MINSVQWARTTDGLQKFEKVVKFAVVIPVGPGSQEIERLIDLVDSLRVYGYGLRWLVLIDDSVINRQLPSRLPILPDCEVVSILNPRVGTGFPHTGGLFTGILSALAWLHEHADPDFILKLDTDSILVRECGRAIFEIFAELPGIGLTGTVGRTCDRHNIDFHHELHVPSPILLLFDQDTSGKLHRSHSRLGTLQAEQELPVAALKVIAAAVENGYHNCHYCQGGAYALSREMLRRMESNGWLHNPLVWTEFDIGEDVLMGMFAYASGLGLADASQEGRPFANHWRGLPFDPVEIISKGFAVIHSLRNDSVPEAVLRLYFLELRQSSERGKLQSAHWPIRPANIEAQVLYGAPATLEVLGARAIQKAVLVGGYEGDLNFGEIAQLQSSVNLNAEQELVPIPFVRAGPLLTNNRLNTIRQMCATEHVVVYSQRALPPQTLQKFGLELVTEITGVVLLHCYGSRLLISTELDATLDWLGELVERMEPAKYLFSGQQVGCCHTVALMNHINKYAPSVIGCRDSLSIANLNDVGIDARYSGDDALDLFLPLRGGSVVPDCNNRQVALNIALPPRVTIQGDGVNPQVFRTIVAQVNHLLRCLARRSPLNAPVIVNSFIDRHDLHDVWSNLRLTEFSSLFPQGHFIDLASLIINGELERGADTLRSWGVNRFLSTYYHPALFLRCLGIPSFLMAFNDSYQQKTVALRQECQTVDQFLDCKQDELTQHCHSFSDQESIARIQWRAFVCSRFSCLNINPNKSLDTIPRTKAL